MATRKKSKVRTRNALEILDRVAGDDPNLRRAIEQETLNARVAQMIFDARIAAGLTQQKLADLAGTTQPVIARLENADYHGHSLTMIQRIARALGQTVDIRFVPA